ncbi:MAG: hypothetical protein AAF533_15430 [Acidobacteriota bacterium]
MSAEQLEYLYQTSWSTIVGLLIAAVLCGGGWLVVVSLFGMGPAWTAPAHGLVLGIGFVCLVMGVGMTARRSKAASRIVFTETGLVLPRAQSPWDELVVAYEDIEEVREGRSAAGGSLGIKSASGEHAIHEVFLSGADELEAICEELVQRVERAKGGGGDGGCPECGSDGTSSSGCGR